jgi:hypothetical protein
VNGDNSPDVKIFGCQRDGFRSDTIVRGIHCWSSPTGASVGDAGDPPLLLVAASEVVLPPSTGPSNAGSLLITGFVADAFEGVLVYFQVRFRTCVRSCTDTITGYAARKSC